MIPHGLHTLIFLLSGLVILAGLVGALRATIGPHVPSANRARAMRWRIRLHLRPGPGFASFAELLIRWSRTRAVFHGRRARPGLGFWRRLASPATDYAVRLGRAQWHYRTWARLEDMVLVIAAPRVGKTGMLADRILTHPGPVLCTSTRTDLFDATADTRAARGPVEVFNPQGVGIIGSTFSWDIVAGCEDPATATRRAESLTGGLGEGTGDMGFWQSKAATALAALLHAAALMRDATIVDVFGWCNRHGDDHAASVLATHPKASRALLAALSEIQGSGRSADSVRLTMSRSLAWVAIPAIAEAVTPAAGRGFDVAEFIATNGTLYMIAADSDHSPVAPLFRAFASHVHYEAGLTGSWSASGRLDPPVLFALDEVTNICPVPLPQWLSDSAGKGILIEAVCHGTGQLESRWGKHGAATIWSTCGTKILLGGISDSDTLEFVSRLCGRVEITTGSERRKNRKQETVQVLPPEVLRQLPDWRALVIRMNLSPVVVKIRPVWKRADRRFAPSPARRRVRVLQPAEVPALAPPAGGEIPAEPASGGDTAVLRPPPAWLRGGSPASGTPTNGRGGSR